MSSKVSSSNEQTEKKQDSMQRELPLEQSIEVIANSKDQEPTVSNITLDRVPNAPKSCIAEIFNGSEKSDLGSVKNGVMRPRAKRETPTRPKDTHNRLFGQAQKHHVTPMVTDTIRSNIQFGETDHKMSNGSPAHSPKTSLMNGSNGSTPVRAQHLAPPMRRNPVTGDGVAMPLQRRPHPAANQREGNPITGYGYKSLNGQINSTVTSLSGSTILHNRVPPGGFSSGLW